MISRARVHVRAREGVSVRFVFVRPHASAFWRNTATRIHVGHFAHDESRTSQGNAGACNNMKSKRRVGATFAVALRSQHASHNGIDRLE